MVHIHDGCTFKMSQANVLRELSGPAKAFPALDGIMTATAYFDDTSLYSM